MNQDTKRATGRTTGLLLQALGEALENPGTEVKFIDHHSPSNHAQYQLCKERIDDIAKNLNLDITVRVSYYAHGPTKEELILFIKSNWVSPYIQRTPVEEAFKKVYGRYPDVYDNDSGRWDIFQQGFEAAQND